jgi:hypothetical protein
MKIHYSEIKHATIWSTLICMVTKQDRKEETNRKSGRDVEKGARNCPLFDLTKLQYNLL